MILSGGIRWRCLTAVTALVDGSPAFPRARLHTRVPVVLPARVADALRGWLDGVRLAAVGVLHANNAREIGGSVRAAARRLRDAGATLLNQAVLLAGVNDDAAALRDLSRALFDAGVLPYYLHLLDRVAGAAHFDADEARARRSFAR